VKWPWADYTPPLFLVKSPPTARLRNFQHAKANEKGGPSRTPEGSKAIVADQPLSSDIGAEAISSTHA